VRVARTKCQLPVRPVCVQVRTGVIYWSQTRVVGTPDLWCQIQEWVGNQHHDWSEWGSLPPAMGWAWYVSQKQILGGQVWARWVRGSVSAAEAGPQDHLCARCRLLGELGACILPRLCVCGVYVCVSCQNSVWTSWWVGGSWVRAGVLGGWRVHAGIWGIHKCGVLGQVCECCVCAASNKPLLFCDSVILWYF